MFASGKGPFMVKYTVIPSGKLRKTATVAAKSVSDYRG